jgi:hypothetical protein
VCSFLLFAWAECNRAQDYVKPGSNTTDPFGNTIKYGELGYPGEFSPEAYGLFGC